ncbi:MAG: hypothetical protein IVW55_09865, partial [Chloroflexi bacterium]|nr:hypothetical protein [Chloroflexota bacterium]
ITSPVPTGVAAAGILNGVAAASTSAVWAVGDSGILHYNGTAWSNDSAPNGGNGIAVHTASDAWAVGNTNILHYNGTAWAVSTPLPANSTLNGVAVIAPSSGSTTEVWAVGSNSTTNPLTMRKVGSGNWTIVPGATPVAATSAYLNSVDYFTTSSVWAVGAYYASGYNHTLIEYWDGSSWRIVPSPNPSRDYNELFHVWVTTPGDVWAVGAYDDSGLNPGTGAGASIPYTGWKTLLLHWNGQSWDQIDSPNLGVGSELVGVTGSSVLNSTLTSNWAVGSYISDGLAPSQTLIAHITAPTPPSRTTSYYELSTSVTMHNEQGCAAAVSGADNNPNGLVFLDYGQPKDWGQLGNDWGTYLIPDGQKEVYRHARIADITSAVESFIDGYVRCETTGLTQLHVAISINNDVHSGGAALNAGHAQAWAQMVKAVQYYARSYPAIFVSAGIDAEPDFDPVVEGQLSDTERWIQAYSDTNISPVFNFGSLDGYPCRLSGYPGFPPPRPCRQDGWDQDKDYRVAWGIDAARPVPEIYWPNYAREWYIVKHWGMEHYPGKAPMEFKGVMTECAGLDCPPTDLDYRLAWPILWLEINSDPVTGLFPDWPTRIQYSASP